MTTIMKFLQALSSSYSTIILTLLISLTTIYKTDTGLIDGSVIILPARGEHKEKHIYFFEDIHSVGHREPWDRFNTHIVAPAETQHDEFLEALEESQPYRKNKQLIILHEQAPQNASANSKDILEHLSKSVANRNLANIIVIDSEVRRVSNVAYHILLLNGDSFHQGLRAYKDGKLCEEITFHDLLNELKQIYANITNFRKAQPEPLVDEFMEVTYGEPFYSFDHTYIQLTEELKKFEVLLMKEVQDLNITPYEFAKDNCKNETINSQLSGDIRGIAGSLLELTLVQQIIQCEHEHIALVTGAKHAWLVDGMLSGFQRKRIIRVRPRLLKALSESKLIEAMLSKEEFLHMLVEFSFFCKVLKKLYPNRNDVEIALLRDSIIDYQHTAASNLFKNSKNIAILTFSLSLCMIIMNSKKTNHTNDRKGLLDEELNKTTSRTFSH